MLIGITIALLVIAGWSALVAIWNSHNTGPHGSLLSGLDIAAMLAVAVAALVAAAHIWEKAP